MSLFYSRIIFKKLDDSARIIYYELSKINQYIFYYHLDCKKASAVSQF